MASENDGHVSLRDRIGQVEAHLSTLAELLTARGIKVELSNYGGIPTLTAIGPRSGSYGGRVVVDSDSWIECVWALAPEADPAHTADVIAGILYAICPAEPTGDTEPPTP